MAIRIQLKRATTARWTEVDPILAAGEEGHETDTGRRKIGDGVTAWSALPYWIGGDALPPHASTHASGGTDPVTLAAIEPSTAAAVPSSAGADNQLVTEADLALAGGSVSTVTVVAASLKPETGTHYIVTNDLELLAPDMPVGDTLFRSTLWLHNGAILSYPETWAVAGYQNPSAANLAEITSADGAHWYLEWRAAFAPATTPVYEGARIYVSTTGNDANDGLTWGTAKRTPEAGGLAADALGVDLWIAAGTYDTLLSSGWAVPFGLRVYGGFAGTEDYLAERERTAPTDGVGASVYTHETVIRNNPAITAGATQCIYLSTPPGKIPPVLSGITIAESVLGVYGAESVTSGYLVDCIIRGCANTTYNGGNGGGVYRVTLTNCVLSGNSATNGGGASGGTLTSCVVIGNSAAASGGGVHNATLTNCVLSGNSAANGGGANGGSLGNCVLSGNSATGNGGGASGGTLTNCVLSGNSATSGGGGGAYTGTLTNCVLSGNSAANGGGANGGSLISCLVMHNAPSGAGTSALTSVTQKGCILWRNTGTVSGTATYTIADASLTLAAFTAPIDIAAGLPDDIPALLAAIQAGGYDVAAGSPVIDAGNNGDNTTAYDLLGRPRKVGTIDIGPYEYQGA